MNIHAIYARVSPFFRKQRLDRMRTRLHPRAGERLLDVGGYPWCWPAGTVPSAITVLNREFPAEARAETGGCELVEGDGCALPFADGSFDIVFSNSVIEHVGAPERQRAFAAEARRVGRRLWVQTPAREFFVEPHVIAPFFHWLPLSWRRRLMRNFTVRGWLERPDPAAVEAFLEEVRLLNFDEMRALFPDCTILRERFLGMTKSYVAVRDDP